MKVILLLIAAAAAAFPQNTLTPQEAADGWLLLFDGRTLFGWTNEGQAAFRVQNGSIVVDSGGGGWLRSNAEFADFALKCDFRTTADGNSGIFLRSAKTGEPHLTGYELQIYDTQPAGFNTGALAGHLKPSKAVKLKHNEWMSYEVEATGNHWIVKIDGETVLTGREGKSLAGHIGLQFNPGKKIEFRNVKVKPLGLQSIFNGKDLSGWKIVDAPKAAQPPEWTVRDGVMHVEKGPGQIETEAQWQDFTLQLDIKTNPKDANHHPNSGVFTRGEPGKFWSGYETQIRNEYRDNDRTNPFDYGTGAMYFYFPARRVVADDGEFFTMTIVGKGRHFSTWVNGHPTAEWDDPRPEGANARTGARLVPGAVSLQAHDPTTNLDFRNIRIASFPKGAAPQ